VQDYAATTKDMTSTGDTTPQLSVGTFDVIDNQKIRNSEWIDFVETRKASILAGLGFCHETYSFMKQVPAVVNTRDEN
jgi:hypothetical protein